MLLSDQECQMYMVLTLYKIIILIVIKVLYKSSFWISVSLPVKMKVLGQMMLDTFSDICEPRIARGDRFLVIIFGDCEAPPSPLASLPSSPDA